ncbi:hypothetical protein ACFYNO_02125 [Kitasatospora sp. NPDC006697]|uniref:hypothetical protein n=1 Tax=Kitasatospora sp. NPDC006697 TaxID=3364020 RepID=UPI0036984107
MSSRHYELLEEARRALPQGFKAELSGDVIVMQATPSTIHQRNLFLVRRQFDPHQPAGVLPSENTDLASPSVDKVRNPDLTYLPDGSRSTSRRPSASRSTPVG